MDVFVDHLLNEGYLIPQNKEQEYCEKNGMHFSRLSNGARIISVQEIAPKFINSSFNVNFLTGSYYDSKNRSGTHHLLEHLFLTKDLFKKIRKNLCSANATTSQKRLRLLLEGPLNLKYKDFGVLPTVEDIFDTIISPYGLSEDKIAIEKKVIKDEIKKRDSDFYNSVWRKLDNYLLGKNNIYLKSIAGSIESIDKITLDDLNIVLNKYITSNNMLVSSYSDGKGKESSYLHETLKQKITSITRTGARNSFYEDKLNALKEFENNVLVQDSTNIKNGRAIIGVVKKLHYNLFSPQDLAFKFIMDQFIKDEFSLNIREKGLGYSHNVYTDYYYPGNYYAIFYLETSNIDSLKNLNDLHKILSNTLKYTKSLNKEYTDFLDIEKMRQKITPFSQENKLSHILGSLSDFDMLADGTYKRKATQRIAVSDLIKCNTDLTNAPSLSFIIGDI